MIIILRKLNVWFSVVRTKLVKIEIALLIWKIYYSIKLDFSKIQFLHELYVCMHDIRQKTKEGNIKNMSIFHDWTSHKKPCDHQWSYSSVSTKILFLKTLANYVQCNLFARRFRSQNTIVNRIISKGNIFMIDMLSENLFTKLSYLISLNFLSFHEQRK